MGKIKEWYQNLKVNQKFTIMIGLIIFVPMVLIWVMFFQSAKKNDINQEIYNAESIMNENYNMLQKTIDSCNMTTEVFLNSKNLIDLLLSLCRGDEISTERFMDFNQNDIPVLERLVNSNPYLYQVRVYAENNDFPEMMPILYHKDRMKQLPWSADYESGKWYFDYEDAIFSEAVVNSTDHMMSLVTEISDYRYGEIGTLEVAVSMDNIFPQIFQTETDSWSCFIDKDGKIYSNHASAEQCIWESRQEEISDKISKQMEKKEKDCFSTAVGDEQVILCYMPIPELGGYFITLNSLSDAMGQIKYQQNIFLLVMIILFTILIVLVNVIVKSILRNFYMMLGTIRQVQMGNLNIRIDNCGTDEMGELGSQFNVMLDKIENLMEENINREVLAKNSEIRALQNQINAHFIYNVLESIKMMAEIDGKFEISDAITSLGKLLRYTMKWTSPLVKVEDELEYIKNYIDLINLRFDYHINLVVSMPRMAYLQQIPKMSLQPIVENAIIHGVEELAEDTVLYIKASIKENILIIEITDSGRGMTKEQTKQLEKRIAGEIEVSGGAGNGIGLKNVQDRIQMTFGEQYGISVASKAGCFTKIIVKVPVYKGG